nr:ATP-binding cassette subfamily G member 4-like isoform X2 [Dermatophagoides farinae]
MNEREKDVENNQDSREVEVDNRDSDTSESDSSTDSEEDSNIENSNRVRKLSTNTGADVLNQTAEPNAKIKGSSNSSESFKQSRLTRTLTPLKQFSLSKLKPQNSQVANLSFDFSTISLHHSMDSLKNLTTNKVKFPKGNLFRRNVKTADVNSDMSNGIGSIARNNDENNFNNNQQQQTILHHVNEDEEKSEIEKAIKNLQNRTSLSSFNKNPSLESNGKADNIQEPILQDEDKISLAIPSSESFMRIEVSAENTDAPSSNLTAGAFEIIWRNVIYYPANVQAEKNDSVEKNSTKKKQRSRRAILNNISGMFRSGQMTGIMGPSGCGKTVLLNCIAGFLPIHIRKENSGDILVNGLNSVRIGFVEQFDHLHEKLTVRETLLFASKIRNAARYYLNHEKVVNSVMERLYLTEMADIAVSRCSNGQRKRVSIAIELVFNSDILMLDEPTTGVDSVNGYQIMNNLKSLTKRRKAIAIVATIHQPSARIFALFDNLIILSCKGSILFQGHPNDLTQILQDIGLKCPMYTSLSDYILEVASGDFGNKSLQTLSHYNNEMNKKRFSDDFNEVEMNSLREAVKRAHLGDQRSLALCTWLVLWRCFICNYRNPFSLKTRIPSLTFMAIFLIMLYGDDIGQISTCGTKYVLWNAKIEDILDIMEEHSTLVHENLSVLLLLNIVALYNSMLALIITIPDEIYVFRREYNNYSYTIWTYFAAKTISELPFTMISTSIFTWAVHRGTGQIFDHWDRIYFTILPCCLITLVGQFIGMMLGTIFYGSQVQAVFV